uniref:Kunitz/Bovine pancreatic trypsin inhibitor domain protein n=1 Tax=Romanomermis culicivorax TaxID=13658 RepID=A0A915I3I9_ROMCU
MCYSAGSFEEVQCDYDNVCWCVDMNGEEVPRSRKIGSNFPGCNSHRMNNTKARANDEEIKKVDVAAVVVNHTKQSINSSEMFLGANICKLPKSYGSYCNATKENTTINKWYFNNEKFSCLAFTYKGCAGNDNKFDTKSQCEMRCKPQDGPTCSGYGNGLQYDNGSAPVGRNCLELQCPAGWVCKPGVFFVTCCNKTVEDYFNDAYNETCSNGAKAFSIARPLWSETYFGDSCNDLRCPSGYECSQTNPLFAKCCSTVVPAANFRGLNDKNVCVTLFACLWAIECTMTCEYLKFRLEDPAS